MERPTRPDPADYARDLMAEWLGSEPLPPGARERIVRGLSVRIADHYAERDQQDRELTKAWATAMKLGAMVDAMARGELPLGRAA